MTIAYEDIARKAFEIWNREGRPEGHDQDHWMRAEAELRNEDIKQQKGAKIQSRDPAMMKTPKASSR